MSSKLSIFQTENGGTTRNRGSKLLGNGFRTKYDVIVGITTTCATLTTHSVCGQFEAESCDSVETVAQVRIEGQSRLAMGL